MSLPEEIKRQVEQVLHPYCQARVPEYARGQVRVDFKFRGNSVTLFEERPAFGRPETWVEIVIAQFRYDRDNGEWTLYCANRNSKWLRFTEVDPNSDFESLLQDVDEDPTGIFWG